MKQTPLTQAHKDLGASMTDFGGWEMPVVYTSLREEHHATRHAAGLFDLCHMGRVKVTGSQRRDFVDYMCSNRMNDLQTLQARYSLLCNEKGTVIDDIIVYANEDYDFVVINAGNRDKDLAHFNAVAKDFDVNIEDCSADLCMIAIQGPKSVEIMQGTTDYPVGDLKYYWSTHCTVLGVDTYIARTGYTGEDGYELYFAADDAVKMWDGILAHGKDAGLIPVGLGARDTLRLEAGMPLYGHEIDDTTTPLEAGLKFAVKLEHTNFIGKDALVVAKEAGLTRKLVGFECLAKKVPRQGFKIFHEDEEIGYVCSGTASPSLEKMIGTAYVPKAFWKLGTELELEIRNKRVPIKLIKKVFYKREK